MKLFLAKFDEGCGPVVISSEQQGLVCKFVSFLSALFCPCPITSFPSLLPFFSSHSKLSSLLSLSSCQRKLDLFASLFLLLKLQLTIYQISFLKYEQIRDLGLSFLAMDGAANASTTPRTVEDIFKDFRNRRTAIVLALTSGASHSSLSFLDSSRGFAMIP
jgi:hypothetical protein